MGEAVGPQELVQLGRGHRQSQEAAAAAVREAAAAVDHGVHRDDLVGLALRGVAEHRAPRAAGVAEDLGEEEPHAGSLFSHRGHVAGRRQRQLGPLGAADHDDFIQHAHLVQEVLLRDDAGGGHALHGRPQTQERKVALEVPLVPILGVRHDLRRRTDRLRVRAAGVVPEDLHADGQQALELLGGLLHGVPEVALLDAVPDDVVVRKHVGPVLRAGDNEARSLRAPGRDDAGGRQDHLVPAGIPSLRSRRPPPQRPGASRP
mmetsp:Transcript_54054/g.167571  ORF Transcript_54054/g.167571 Transcript_54054/m.167571 type:complete len:261 (+) Transcript_54054:354-1136(+)